MASFPSIRRRFLLPQLPRPVTRAGRRDGLTTTLASGEGTSNARSNPDRFHASRIRPVGRLPPARLASSPQAYPCRGESLARRGGKAAGGLACRVYPAKLDIGLADVDGTDRVEAVHDRAQLPVGQNLLGPPEFFAHLRPEKARERLARVVLLAELDRRKLPQRGEEALGRAAREQHPLVSEDERRRQPDDRPLLRPPRGRNGVLPALSSRPAMDGGRADEAGRAPRQTEGGAELHQRL